MARQLVDKSLQIALLRERLVGAGSPSLHPHVASFGAYTLKPFFCSDDGCFLIINPPFMSMLPCKSSICFPIKLLFHLASPLGAQDVALHELKASEALNGQLIARVDELVREVGGCWPWFAFVSSRSMCPCDCPLLPLHGWWLSA